MSHLRKGADGHLLKNAAGTLVKACENIGTDCGGCDTGTMPAYFDILFEGITACGCIGTIMGDGFYHHVDFLDDPNGVYRVTQDGVDPCVYQTVGGDVPAVRVRDRTFNTLTDCQNGTNVVATTTYTANIVIWDLTVGYMGFSVGAGTSTPALFRVSGVQCPTDGLALTTNEHTAGDCAGHSPGGDGTMIGGDGTATVSIP